MYNISIMKTDRNSQQNRSLKNTKSGGQGRVETRKATSFAGKKADLERKKTSGTHGKVGAAQKKQSETRGKNNRSQYLSVYKVQRSDELLEFLLKKQNASRNNVKALLSRCQVLVNGSVVTQYNFALAKDDEIKIARESVRENEPLKISPALKTGAKGKAATPAPKLAILYEDDDLIAVDKPAGLLSVESDKENECAFGQVLKYLQAKDKSLRPFILHRIDKETSGVLIFAKNIKLHSMLRMHWNELVQTREYFALCEGTFEKKEDTVISYLRENANNLVYSTQDPSGQKAVTRYKVEKEGNGYSLLRVEIDTGRKNQIRVHMQLLGHPIVGDDKYGHTKNPLGRLGLHASCLSIIHPVTKELLNFRSSVPAAFRKFFLK